MRPWSDVWRRAAREGAVAMAIAVVVRWSWKFVRLARHSDSNLPVAAEVALVVVPIVAALVAAWRARRAPSPKLAPPSAPAETFRTAPKSADDLDARLDEELSRMSDRDRP